MRLINPITGLPVEAQGEVAERLKAKGFKENEIISANLGVKRHSGNGIIDRFRDRVMFPIIDLRGNVIAFGGRIMSDAKPKYLNSNETLIFNKRKNLFGLNLAKKTKAGSLILVEGNIDVVALHQYGFDNAVASLGTAFTPQQAELLKRYADKATLCYDSDEAGQKATARAINILRNTGLNVRVLTIPDGKDPDEFIRVNGADKFREVVKNALYVEDYLLERAKNDNTDPETGMLDRGRYQEDICLYGSWMNDDIKATGKAV